MNCPLLQSNQATATEHFNLSNIISISYFEAYRNRVILRNIHFTYNSPKEV